MAPLLVGDYISFTGSWVNEPAGRLLTVNTLEANVGYYTAPGTKPAYIFVESAAFGIVNNQNAEIAETRAVAFVTDPSTTLQWYAIDVDPCTGVSKNRNIQLLQPSQIAPLGRAVFRLGQTGITPATRQVGFQLSTGTVQLSFNNGSITAGQYIQPIFTYNFPELTTFGLAPLPLTLDVMPFIAQGGGPYIPGNPLLSPPSTCVIIGQLDPWPATAVGAAPPAGTSCGACVLPIPGSSTTPTPTPSPSAGPADAISNVVGALTSTRGVVSLTVTAQSNNQVSTLSVSAQGSSPIAAQVMVKGTTTSGLTSWSLVIAIKGNKPTGFTVTSSGGAPQVSKTL
jgi:hypothetical protein